MWRGPILQIRHPRSARPLSSQSQALSMGWHAWVRLAQLVRALLAGLGIDRSTGRDRRAADRHLALANGPRRRRRRADVVGRIEIGRLRHPFLAVAIDRALHAFAV